jgi:CsoR family transcriptional regulator, copper-sensing transcriptional repressor
MRKEIKNRAARRLKIIEGQVKGLQRMVEKDVYCVDVINQSLAIKQALSGVEDLLLERHLATHVAEQRKSGRGTKAIKEILDLYKLSKKK